MLFLRVTPLIPNWFVNIASPIVGVPFSVFVLSTAIGLVPANYFHAQTGATLASITSWSLSDNWPSFVTLFVLQFVALLPTLLKRRLAAVESKARSQ